MRKLYDWFYGWAATLRIMVFERELYRSLTAEFNPDDFIEVSPPPDDYLTDDYRGF